MTPRAEDKMADILQERGIEDPMLRVFAAGGGGGCGGPQFGMSIAEGPETGDIELKLTKLTLFMDASSAPLLDGAEIDFVEDQMTRGFTIYNPKLAAQGCGSGGCSPGSCGG